MRKLIIYLVALVAVVAIAIGSYFSYKAFAQNKSTGTIKVGILHSLTGTMAISELGVVDATKLAIQEINDAGGILGKQIEAIVADGKSDPLIFAKAAENLINEQAVEVVFGCWTSASRKMVKPVFEKYNHLLFYPLQYEGLELSPNIIYTGATPNQQIMPGVIWCFENLGKSFFLVGSDYVYPRAANEIIKELIKSVGGTVVGEEYMLLGSKDVDHIIEKIKATKPAVIINNINGDSNIPFFKKLREAGITPEQIPTISFSIAEPELKQLGTESIIGDYSSWNYFESINSPANDKFIKNFKNTYGNDRVLSNPMEAAYFGVYLWAQTVQEIGSSAPDQVRKGLKNQAYNAPEGVVSVDPENQHVWKKARIGKIQSNGQFNIIWDSGKAIRPTPYPVMYRDKQEWDNFLASLYTKWQNQWAPS